MRPYYKNCQYLQYKALSFMQFNRFSAKETVFFEFSCFREFQAFLDACSSTREWEIFYLARKIGYKNETHTLTYTKWSPKLSISILSDYYKTVFSILSPGNEKLFKSCTVSRAVSQVIMRVRKPKVEYKLALHEKLQESILMYYYKKTINNLTSINLNTRLIIASNKINLETEFEHLWLEFPGKHKNSKLYLSI